MENTPTAAPLNAALPPQISVIVPVFRNAETLAELHRRVEQALAAHYPGFEIIFVEDAGPDGSLSLLKSLAAGDPHVGLLSLARNVGQHRAIMLGMRYARGAWIVLMDADLQDPPEAIPALVAHGQAGYAAVFAGRRGRYEGALRLFTSNLYRWVLRRLTGLPADAGIFVAIDARMRATLLGMGGPYPSIVAMIGCTGLPLASLPVTRATRPAGRSAYNSWGRLKSGLRALAWIVDWKWRSLFGRPDASSDPGAATRLQADDPAIACFGAPFQSGPATEIRGPQ